MVGQMDIRPNSSRQGQAQEFGIWTLVMDFGLLLWTEDNLGLPTGQLTITKTLKTFL